MLQAIRSAEEKKRAEEAKAQEQAEGRNKRAESRLSARHNPADGQGDGRGEGEVAGRIEEEVVGEEEVRGQSGSGGGEGIREAPVEEKGEVVTSDSSELEADEKDVKKRPKKRSKKEKEKMRKKSSSVSSNDRQEEGVEKRELFGSLVEKDQVPYPVERKGPVRRSSPDRANRQKSLTDRLVDAIHLGDLAGVKSLREEIDAYEAGKKKEGIVVKGKEKEKEKGKRKEKRGKRKERKTNKKKGKRSGKKRRRSSSSEGSGDSSDSSSLGSGGSDSRDSFSSSSQESSDGNDSDSDTASSVEEKEQKPIKFAFKKISAFDLPDLPIQWEKNFRRMKYYVPLTVFDATYIDAYKAACKTKGGKLKWDTSPQSREQLERQMTYGEFILACDLEYRYAAERYKYEDYAVYVEKHKAIVSMLARKHKCWMVGLRYHLAVRAVTFRVRSSTTYEKGRDGKKKKKVDEVILPDGLQTQAEDDARWDAQTAGDLKYKGNPYAVSQPKFGYDFVTGQEKEQSSKSKNRVASDDSLDNGRGGERGPKKRRGGNRGHYQGYSKPYAHQSNQFARREGNSGKDWVASGQQHASTVASGSGSGSGKGGKKTPKGPGQSER